MHEAILYVVEAINILSLVSVVYCQQEVSATG